MIIDHLQKNAESHPLHTAVINPDGQSVHYSDLVALVGAIAVRLSELGVVPGDRVVVLLSQHHLLPASALAIIKLGAVYVPVDPDWPAERVSHILNELQPAAILALPEQVLGTLDSQVEPIRLDAVTLLNAGKTDPSPLQGYRYADHDPCYIFYTSGTTGFPKGVELTYANLKHYIESAASTYRFQDDDIQLAIARFTFSISLFDVILPFYCGGALKLTQREQMVNPARLVELLADVTCFHMGPALLTSLAHFAIDESVQFPHIRHVSSGGDSVPPELLELCRDLFPNAELWVIYGSTELACMALTWPVPAEGPIQQTYVGKPFKNNSLLLIDDQLTRVETGEVGEVAVSGPGVALGYIQRAELNEEKFVTLDGKRYYRTGDVGQLEGDGFLKLLGRTDFQIKINGIRIEAQEIEHWIKKFEGVKQAFAIGANNARHEKKLVAFYTSANPLGADDAEILKYLRQHLPSYMVPSQLTQLEQIPVNFNGKIDRKKLIEIAEESLSDQGVNFTLDDPLSQSIIGFWQSCSVNPKSLESHFFESGGDSIAAAELAYKMGKHFNLDMDIDHIYEYPRLTDQIDLVDNFAQLQEGRAQDNLIKPLNAPRPNSRNIFFLPGIGGHPVSFQNMGEHFSKQWNVYCLLYPIFAKEEHDDLESVAARLVEDMIRCQPSGPYIVAGYSLGGFVCLEIARLLTQAGHSVQFLAIEARIFEVAPEKSFLKRLPYTLIGKCQTWYEKWSKDRPSFLFKNLIHENEAIEEEKYLPPNFQKVAAVSRKQRARYKLSACEVPSVVVKCSQSPWWDCFREWPKDYGWSIFTQLKGIVYAPGDHLSMTAEKVNHPGLAVAMENALAIFDTENRKDQVKKTVEPAPPPNLDDLSVC